MKVSKKKIKYDSVAGALKEMMKSEIMKGKDNKSLRYVLVDAHLANLLQYWPEKGLFPFLAR